MKKIFLVIAITLGFTVTATSCKDKEPKASEETHIHDKNHVEETKETASNTLYQCPMDCENGKSYVKEGSCPVCKMDLKAKEVDMDSNNSHDKNHDGEDTHDHDTEVNHDEKHHS